MKREQLDKMDINVTHNLSSRENPPEGRKGEKFSEHYCCSFSNSVYTGIKR